MGSCLSKSKKGDAARSHNASKGKGIRDVVPAQFLATSRVQSYTDVSSQESLPGGEAAKNTLAERLRPREPPNAGLLSNAANTSRTSAKGSCRQHVEQRFTAETRKISSVCVDSASVSAISKDLTSRNTRSLYSPEMGREIVSQGSAATDKFLTPPISSVTRPALAFESLNSNKSQNSESFNSHTNVSNGKEKEILHSVTKQQDKATALPTNILASGSSLRDPASEDDPPGPNEHINLTPVSTNYKSSEESNLSFQVSSTFSLPTEADVTPRLIVNASNLQRVTDMVPNLTLIMKPRRSHSPEHYNQLGDLSSSSKTKNIDDFKERLAGEERMKALFLDGQTDSKRVKTCGYAEHEMKLDLTNFNKFQPAHISNTEKEEQQGKDEEVDGGKNETMEHNNRILDTICAAISHERQSISQGYEKTSQHRQSCICSFEESSCTESNYQIEKKCSVSASGVYSDKWMELEKEEASKIETQYELEKHEASNGFELPSNSQVVGDLEILSESLGNRIQENTPECIFNRSQKRSKIIDMEAKTTYGHRLDNELLNSEVGIEQDKLIRVLSSGTQKDSTSAAQHSVAVLVEPDLVESDSETFEFKQAVSLFPENFESLSKEGFVTLTGEKRHGTSRSLGQTELGSADRRRTWDVFDMKGSPVNSNRTTENGSLNDRRLSKESLTAIQTISYDSHESDLRSQIRERDGGLGNIRQFSVVSTGDALLFSGSNSDEFHLIPSKSLVVDMPSSNWPMISQLSQEDSCLMSNAISSEYQQEAPPNALTIDDIILLLENNELDEEDLISLLINAKSSCQASDVASESSFEFKVRSTGSTPHSTPSTPILSAGSTPRRISQLTPIALTPEEIAEIWGIFESRQTLPSY